VNDFLSKDTCRDRRAAARGQLETEGGDHQGTTKENDINDIDDGGSDPFAGMNSRQRKYSQNSILSPATPSMAHRQ
jgi:hypothetical protein